MAGQLTAIHPHSIIPKARSMTPIDADIPWQDIAGMVFLACLCLYFGLAAAKFSPQARHRLPSFVFNRGICFTLTGAFVLLALAKLLRWF